jgi:hypothetical protein
MTDRYDQQFLGNYALINIKDILARIKGIGRVNVLGASDYSMRIWIKPDRLAHLGITVARDHGCHPGPERDRTGRQIRRRTGPAGHRIHLHGAPARTPAE